MSIVCLSHANDFGLLSASEWTLLPDKTIQLQVQRGDILQSLQGTVWITVDGQRQDLLLSVSDMHTVAEDAVLRVSGFDESRLMVLSHLPVQMIEKHEVSGWHNWLRTMGSWALQRTELAA
jgi:hypothetical protein